MAARTWQSVGRSADLLWGLCQGSAVYQVKVDLTSLGYHCSCPSRKFPCKHTLGLLLLYADSPAAAAEAPLPDWAEAWLAKRREREDKKSQAPRVTESKPVDEKSQQRRAAQRDDRVGEGIARLDLWLTDLVRCGFAGVDSRPSSFWAEQSKRLVDAQAPGLSAAVGRLASIPGSGPTWPTRLLGECGRLKLLIEAHGRLPTLDPPLAQEVRQLIGWTVSQPELEAAGEQATDSWIVIGQSLDDEDRVRVQRSWLLGRQSARLALVLQFSAMNQPFAESILPGTEQAGTLLFYPGVSRLRARWPTRVGAVNQAADCPGLETIEAFLTCFTEIHARLPWLIVLAGVIDQAVLVPAGQRWQLVDRIGQALPLVDRDYWRLLAITGGRPASISGEWDGTAWRPLGVFSDGRFWVA
jgi:hypothetical protein